MLQDIFPHRFNNEFLANKTISANDYILYFRDNKLLVKNKENSVELPQKRDLSEINEHSETTFLFTLDETSCFMLWDDISVDETLYSFKDTLFFRTLPQPETAWISLVGFHLHNWYEEHRFCGKCGAKTKHKSDERAVYCSKCNTHFYPKISPAVIVAITCGEKILLANNVNFKPGWFSLIAGYADVGETLEDTVRREVKEEIGIDVYNIRYFGSQPWPLSGSMMVGFTAEAEDAQPIVIDGKEITSAAWFKRGALPEHPTNISISGELIERFEKNRL